MNTPICDFVRKYAERDALRLHMPGHKGTGFLGVEGLDITEIEGADSLYEARGIIGQSEANASKVFGCDTFYSTEGSSQCIRAMLYLAMLHGKKQGRRPVVAAGRNAHKTFLSAAALLDLDVLWLYPEKEDSYLACNFGPEYLDRQLQEAEEKPFAVYVTSPDYLGNVADIPALAEVCHRHGALLVVDNAHGAYLKFLPLSQFPIDLGADLCCDSAHKTLPVLTGGAYLHISPKYPHLTEQAKNALILFGSTSPSYLIMQSLDAANVAMEDFAADLKIFAEQTDEMRERLRVHGYRLWEKEALKMTIEAKAYGYGGREFSKLLLEKNVVAEFADEDFVVLMLTPEIGKAGLDMLEKGLMEIPQKPAVVSTMPRICRAEKVMSIREAAMSPAQVLPVEECKGRILAAATVGCPPAVPILVCGERVDDHAVECFRYYGIETCSVVAE